MRICYIDESGDGQRPNRSHPQVPPAFVICGLVVESGQIADLTTDFLKVKKRFHPNKAGLEHLDGILNEVKGSNMTFAADHVGDTGLQLVFSIGSPNCFPITAPGSSDEFGSKTPLLLRPIILPMPSVQCTRIRFRISSSIFSGTSWEDRPPAW